MKIAVIGAGASGVIATIVAKSINKDLQIDIFDSNSVIGKKILASGNGRCNISNTNLSSKNYMSKNPSFVEYALEEFGFTKLEEFFKDKIGLHLDIKESGKVYPLSNDAKSVVNLLDSKLETLKITKHLETTISKIQKQNDKFVLFSEKNSFKSYDKVLISSGLGAYPQLKASENALEFAKSFGHKCQATYPSLVGLNIENEFCKRVAGVKKEVCISLYVNSKKHSGVCGDLLFTSYGVSGFAVLDISQVASLKLLQGHKVEIKIDFFARIDTNQLTLMLEKTLNSNQNQTTLVALQGLIPSKLAKEILYFCNIPKEQGANTLSSDEIKRVVHSLKNLSFEVVGTQGFKHCEVSGGGVCVDGVCEKSFESKLCKGLYFSGEALDITGQRGGYNLHFAFASGYLAGIDLAK